ncbi:MAG TPA: MFS transporter [Nevskiaceae bacterium]|nr:MFS transporter [Nevskiaceae bacterium]
MSSPTRLPRGLLVAFCLPSLVLGVMHGPEGMIQSVYAKHAALSLTALAAAMLATKMFDAITYPLIGTLSDRAYARTGSRRGWVIGGSLLSVVGVWFLLRPPQEVTVVYFGIWMAVTYVGWKVIEIPLQAWSYTLSADYAQRARVQAWRAFAQIAGPFLFFAMPYIAMQIGYSDSSELDFRNLGFAAVVCAVALPLATAIMVARVPSESTGPPPAPRRFSAKEFVRAVRDNPPLLRLCAAFLPFNLLVGVLNGVAYLYIDAYLGLGKQFAAIAAAALLATLVGLPFWSALAARYERHRVWAGCMAAAGIAFAGFAAASPGPLALPLCFVCYPIIFFCVSSSVIVYTMSADIVDYGKLNLGEDHGGLYGALFFFLQKSLMGVSAAAGLALIGMFGFDATAAVQSASGVIGIKLTGAILPAIGMIGAAAIIWNYPLTRARMAEVQAALAKRDSAIRPDQFSQ